MADLVTCIGPGAQFEKTGLYIQREIFNVNVTGGLVGGRRLPLHQAVVVHNGLRVQSQLVVTVSAVKRGGPRRRPANTRNKSNTHRERERKTGERRRRHCRHIFNVGIKINKPVAGKKLYL